MANIKKGKGNAMREKNFVCKKVLKYAEGFAHFVQSLKTRRRAFTLAEVLLTIGIIGVVAALTLPTIINETRDKEYAAARKKALATIGEAVRLITIHGDIRYAENAQDFVENYLKKQLQMIKTCDNNNLRDCGIETNPNKMISLAEKKMTMPTKISELAVGMSSGDAIDPSSTSYGFVMANGYSVNLFYNPSCMSDNKDANHWGQDRVCVNAIYDMNGLGQPNEVGKDIGFVTIMYPDVRTTAVAPDVHKRNAQGASFYNAGVSCTTLDKEYTLPNRDELLAMYFNGNLLGITSGYYWSASEASAELGWGQGFGNGGRYRNAKSDVGGVRCVRR